MLLCLALCGMQEQESVRRGMGEKPAGQVYYMPAASDAYVAAFRCVLPAVGLANVLWTALPCPVHELQH